MNWGLLVRVGLGGFGETLRAFVFLRIRRPPRSTLFPDTTLFRSGRRQVRGLGDREAADGLLSGPRRRRLWRSEEHTSELQSHVNLVCRLLLEKKNNLVQHGTSARASVAAHGVG